MPVLLTNVGRGLDVGGMEVGDAGEGRIEVAGMTVSGTESPEGRLAGVWVNRASVSPQATAAMATRNTSKLIFRRPLKMGRCNIDLAAAGKGSPAPCRLIIATA